MCKKLSRIAATALLSCLPFIASAASLISIPALANSTTISISSPSDGLTISDTHTIVTGLASAIGDGQGVDFMLVMDNSGSLSSTDPTKERFAAVRQLFSSLDVDANVNFGLVAFESSATLVSPLQSGSSSRSTVEAWMQSATPGGGTDIESGIRAASQELITKGRANASRIILVFTDGQDTSSNSEVAARDAAGQGQVVHLVGLLTADTAGEPKLRSIVQHGGGQFFRVDAPSQLASLFSGSQLVGIQSVTVANKTTGKSALNVNFSTGSYSAAVDLQKGSNVLEAIATSTEGQTAVASVTVNVPVKCLEDNVPGELNYNPACPSTFDPYQVKLHPQVLMAGFDPMLLDIGDDEFKVMAVVREGAQPIRHVKLSENTGSFSMSMNLEGQLPNGDKIYSLAFVGAAFLPSMNDMLSNLFGSNVGEFNITVVDGASMTHSFPVLEFGTYRDVSRDTPLTAAQSYTQQGLRRGRPQTLIVGFDPVMVDLSDSSFKVKAIVRKGSVAVRSVTLKTNNNLFSVKMQKESTLPNGDEMYSLKMAFDRGAFPAGAFKDLFGTAYESEFVVETIDEASQRHQFPALNVCDCPAIR